jgi:hypothetical protein
MAATTATQEQQQHGASRRALQGQLMTLLRWTMMKVGGRGSDRFEVAAFVHGHAQHSRFPTLAGWLL